MLIWQAIQTGQITFTTKISKIVRRKQNKVPKSANPKITFGLANEAAINIPK